MFGSNVVPSTMKVNKVVVPTPVPPAPAANVYAFKGGMEMITSMIPGCCGLKVIRKLGCLGKTDAASVKATEQFDALTSSGKADDGNWNTYGKSPDCIAIISTSKSYHGDQEEWKRQIKFLEDKGWVCLASWESKESKGTNYMYGSKGIKPGKVQVGTY